MLAHSRVIGNKSHRLIQLYRCYHSKSSVKLVKQTASVGKTASVRGWVRSLRSQKHVSFIVVNDGSDFHGIQAVISNESEIDLKNVGTGASVEINGTLVTTPKGDLEIQASSLNVLGGVTEDYPLAKKRHSLEHLRDVLHLRPRR